MNDVGYVWHEDKYERARAEHGVELLEAIEVDLDPDSLTEDDPQGHWGRYLVVGRTRAGRILQVVCSDEDLPLTRFITAFEAHDFWRKRYDSQHPR